MARPDLPIFPLALIVAALLPLCTVAAPVTPDCSRLTLKGNGHVQDRFSLAV